jgi:hypothetical protein
VEAAIAEALSEGAEILAIFQNMTGVLQIMRNKNLSYGKSSMKHEVALPGGLWGMVAQEYLTSSRYIEDNRQDL